MTNWIRRLFTKAASALAIAPRVVVTTLTGIATDFLSLVSEGYRANALVYACIRLKATATAEAPLVVYDTRQSPPVPVAATAPLVQLLQQPNPYMTQYEMVELIVTQLELCGVSFWWKQRGRTGQVVALWPLRPDRVVVVRDPQAIIAGYRYLVDGEAFDLPPQDVLAFNYPDPASPDGGITGGLGTLQALARDVDIDNEAGLFASSVLQNYATPGLVLRVKTPLTRDEAEQLKRAFRERYGALQRGEPIVLAGDDVELQPVSYSLNDLAFPDLRALGEARICAGFGVPAILVGAKVGLDRSTFSNVAEAREYFAETTLAVIWRRLSDQFTVDLAREFDPTYVVRFDTSGLPAFQRLQEQRAARYLQAFQLGAITRNELRAVLGLPPLDPSVGEQLSVPASVADIAVVPPQLPPGEKFLLLDEVA